MVALWVPAGLLLCLPPGCTPKQYAEWADRDAYATLAEGQQEVLGEVEEFSVDYAPFAPVGEEEQVIKIGEKEIPLQPSDEPLVQLSLVDCLEVALRNSRSFQTRKEDLYTSALALAETRRGWWPPLFGGALTSEAQTTRQTGNDPVEDRSASAEVGPTLTQKLMSGGVLTLGLAVDLATDFTGMQNTTVGSLLEANFTQPLLRGAWRGLAYEEQYRRERDFLFSVFEYERFTQQFAAGIVQQYYNVLQRRDELENERANIERLKQTLELTKTLVQGGQVSRIEQDQAQQDLLNAQIRLRRSEQNYRDRLDEYKLTLGVPVAAQFELEYPGALKQLVEAGPKPIPFEEREAIRVALSTRPDVLEEGAELRDAQRDVEIAVDQFLPQLDVVVGLDAPGTEPREFYKVRFHEHTRFARVRFEYELDQTENRNDYREALIALDKAWRDFAEFIDGVVLDVRRSYRSLLQSRESYKLQVRSVAIADRRRKLASLQQKQGLASARDVLEAEEAFRSAQNGMTSALVQYTNTRLDFLGKLGMLAVDERGMLNERTEPLTFERIVERYPYTSAQ